LTKIHQNGLFRNSATAAARRVPGEVDKGLPYAPKTEIALSLGARLCARRRVRAALRARGTVGRFKELMANNLIGDLLQVKRASGGQA
jgi:hypothetical protein